MRAVAAIVLAGCNVVFPLDPSDDPFASCPPSYTTKPGRFRLIEIPNSFGGAEAMCEADQPPDRTVFTHLAVPHDATELGAIRNLATLRQIWIGIQRVDGKFGPITTETNSFLPFCTSNCMPPWATGEPNGDGDCVDVLASGGLNDEVCEGGLGSLNAAVCECDLHDLLP
jgi:hypothetical protein